MRFSRKMTCSFPGCGRVVAFNQFSRHFRSKHVHDGEGVLEETVMSYAQPNDNLEDPVKQTNDHKRKKRRTGSFEGEPPKLPANLDTAKPLTGSVQQRTALPKSDARDNENSSDGETPAVIRRACGPTSAQRLEMDNHKEEEATGDLDNTSEFEVIQATELVDGTMRVKLIARYAAQEDANKAVLSAFRRDTHRNWDSDLLRSEDGFLKFVARGDSSGEYVEARRQIRWESVASVSTSFKREAGA